MKNNIPEGCYLIFQAGFHGGSLNVVDLDTLEIYYSVYDVPIDGGDPGVSEINGKEYIDYLEGYQREEWLKRIGAA